MVSAGIVKSKIDATSDAGREVSCTSYAQPSSAAVTTDREAPCTSHAHVSTADRKAPRASYACVLSNSTAADQDTAHAPYPHGFLVNTSIAAGEPTATAADGIATLCTRGSGDGGRNQLA